jgi:hypothetical protein
MNTMQMYPVLCSWCKPVETVVSYSTVAGSSGICLECYAKSKLQLAALVAARTERRA